MGFWDEARDAHEQTYGGGEPNQANWTHELAAGGAAFAAFELFEKKQRDEGKVVSHGFAKGILAGLAGAEVDRLAETKGEDAWDRHKAKQEAEHRAERMYDEHYIDGQGADQYDPNQYEPHPHSRHERRERYD